MQLQKTLQLTVLVYMNQTWFIDQKKKPTTNHQNLG